MLGLTELTGFNKNKRLVELDKLDFQIIEMEEVELSFQRVNWFCSKRGTKCFEYKISETRCFE